jgi:hypothetical protein
MCSRYDAEAELGSKLYWLVDNDTVKVPHFAGE